MGLNPFPQLFPGTKIDIIIHLAYDGLFVENLMSFRTCSWSFNNVGDNSYLKVIRLFYLRSLQMDRKPYVPVIKTVRM